jgi:hypothetical protein
LESIGQNGPQGTLQIQLVPHTFSVLGQMGNHGIFTPPISSMVLTSQGKTGIQGVIAYLLETLELTGNMSRSANWGTFSHTLDSFVFSSTNNNKIGIPGNLQSELDSLILKTPNSKIGVQADVALAGPTVYITGAGVLRSKRVYTVHITTVPVRFIADTTTT